MLLHRRPIASGAGAPRCRRLSAANPTSSRVRRGKEHAPSVAAANATDAANTATTNPLALKEWAVAIDALLTGDQVVLLRKGGLLDGKFKLEAREFLLFPTTFHVDDPRLLRPGAAERHAAALAMPEPKTLAERVPIRCRAVVEAAWSTKDGRVVEALAEEEEGLHVWGPAFTEARMKWRPGAEMTLFLVRAFSCDGGCDGGGEGGGGGGGGGNCLPVRQREDYYGCFSWVRVEPEDGQQPRWRPVLPEAEFARRAAAVARALERSGIEATPLQRPPPAV
jgi:hypothetical protein